ncbi:MAG: segregation and condensation protein A [Candidatus Methylomirabilia bacterium]
MSTAVEPRGITVRVESFEGPLDLLLHLCRTSEIDLACLPIRIITDQYVSHLEAIEFQDLEAAGAFVVMAATLMYLKSRLLLPVPGSDDEQLDEEGERMRQELEERLRAYARIKEIGLWFAEREEAQSRLFGRPASGLPAAEEIPLEDLSVHLLVEAYQKLLQRAERDRPQEVGPDPPSVLERMAEIVSLLRHTWSLLFSSLVGDGRTRSELSVTLLALLEVVRVGQARARQQELFGEIVIERAYEERPDHA